MVNSLIFSFGRLRVNKYFMQVVQFIKFNQLMMVNFTAYSLMHRYVLDIYKIIIIKNIKQTLCIKLIEGDFMSNRWVKALNHMLCLFVFVCLFYNENIYKKPKSRTKNQNCDLMANRLSFPLYRHQVYTNKHMFIKWNNNILFIVLHFEYEWHKVLCRIWKL